MWVIKNYRLLTIKKIINFIEAQYRLYFLKDEIYISEQVSWRLEKIKIKSPECLIKGICVGCGCKEYNKCDGCFCNGESCEGCGCEINEKIYETEQCSRKCYPKWMSKKEWINFKMINNVSI